MNKNLERVEELGKAPRHQHLNGRIQRIRTQLKANLIVSLSSRSVREKNALFLQRKILGGKSFQSGPNLLRHFQSVLDDAWTSNRCAHQINILVKPVCLDRWHNKVVQKVLHAGNQSKKKAIIVEQSIIPDGNRR